MHNYPTCRSRGISVNASRTQHCGSLHGERTCAIIDFLGLLDRIFMDTIAFAGLSFLTISRRDLDCDNYIFTNEGQPVSHGAFLW